MNLKSKLPFLMIAILILAGCSGIQNITTAPTEVAPSATPFQPTETLLPPTATPEPTITLTPTPSYPLEGLGPTGFPQNVNPFTGLEVPNPELLNRRPIVVKVENLPRAHRPQSGVSSADLVYEYYTEEGTTRFAAVFYGSDSEMVGPIRSGRFFDVNVVQAYKATFVFGYAWAPVFQRFLDSNFGNRLVIEGAYTNDVLYRQNDILFVNTSKLPQVYSKMGIDNSRQNEDGMFFQMQTPAGGSLANTIYARYSGAIYNRWDYDIASGKYLRFSDSDNAFSVDAEKYLPLMDKNNSAQISADNVVVILVNTVYVVHDASGEVVDMTLLGSGSAYIARDGQIYPVQWVRISQSDVLSLVGTDGKPFPFKPGNTWFEIIGTSSSVTQPDASSWRFTFSIP
jgi:hypothetical protein